MSTIKQFIEATTPAHVIYKPNVNNEINYPVVFWGLKDDDTIVPIIHHLDQFIEAPMRMVEQDFGYDLRLKKDRVEFLPKEHQERAVSCTYRVFGIRTTAYHDDPEILMAETDDWTTATIIMDALTEKKRGDPSGAVWTYFIRDADGDHY